MPSKTIYLHKLAKKVSYGLVLGSGNASMIGPGIISKDWKISLEGETSPASISKKRVSTRVYRQSN